MFVAKWYTRASRVRIVIAKFDGRWKLPGGPYPIPELVALLGGILFTLFMLPRLGQPALTGALGVGATAIGVAAMRRMPYSPVKFSTRVHRIVRLYSSPVSTSTTGDLRSATAVSTVRSSVMVLDVIADQLPPPNPRSQRGGAAHADAALSGGWEDLFERPASAAADLFC